MVTPRRVHDPVTGDAAPVVVQGWGRVVTASILAVHEAVREVVDTRALGCVTGPVGVGKSTAVADAAGPDAVSLSFRARPTMTAFRTALWERLWPRTPMPRSRTDFEGGVTRALNRARRTLVLDSADVLPREALEYVAALVADTRLDVAVIAVGPPSWAAALHRTAPKLHSYAFRHARLDVLDDAEAVTVAPLLHPVWTDATAHHIRDVNRQAGGTLRGWHHTTARRLAGGGADTAT